MLAKKNKRLMWAREYHIGPMAVNFFLGFSSRSSSSVSASSWSVERSPGRASYLAEGSGDLKRIEGAIFQVWKTVKTDFSMLTNLNNSFDPNLRKEVKTAIRCESFSQRASQVSSRTRQTSLKP